MSARRQKNLGENRKQRMRARATMAQMQEEVRRAVPAEMRPTRELAVSTGRDVEEIRRELQAWKIEGRISTTSVPWIYLRKTRNGSSRQRRMRLIRCLRDGLPASNPEDGPQYQRRMRSEWRMRPYNGGGQMIDTCTDEDLPEPPDLSDEAVRQRLGPSALRGFTAITNAWQVPEAEARQLLGVPPGTNILDLDPTRFREDALLRISCVIGIYKALHIYCPDDLADQWVRRANDGAMFGGRSPLAYMTSGGLEALRGVRKMLDAWCQGY